MTTESEHPSFYCVLSNALIRGTGVDALLGHPVFRNRAMQICYRFAGHDNVESLFKEVCLRVSEDAGTHDSQNVPTEEMFFRWISDEVRRTLLTKRGIFNRWLESKAVIFPTEETDFVKRDQAFDRAEGLLPEELEEERALRSSFGLACGLEGHGRILEGRALEVAIAEHKRRLKVWKDSWVPTGFPFSYIGLFNGGKEIASCGEFFDFKKHESINELDPQAGLQIRGISNSAGKESLLLGFCLLAGVRHDGQEKLLELENGYTVGVGIKRLGVNIFEVHFRCVETRVIEEERENAAEPTKKAKAVGRAAGAGNLFSTYFRPSPSFSAYRRLKEWLTAPGRWQAAVYPSIALLFLTVISGALLSEKSLDQTPATTLRKRAAEQIATTATPPTIEPGVPANTQRRSLAKRYDQSSSSQSEELKALLNNHPRKPGVSRRVGPARPPLRTAPSKDMTAPTDDRVTYNWQLYSEIGMAASNHEGVLHFGTGKALRAKVFSEIRNLNIPVTAVKGSDGRAPRLRIEWVAFHPEKVQSSRITVVVQVIIFGDNVRIADYLSRPRQADNLELAYEDAVRELINSEFFNFINPSEKNQSDSADGMSESIFEDLSSQFRK